MLCIHYSLPIHRSKPQRRNSHSERERERKRDEVNSKERKFEKVSKQKSTRSWMTCIASLQTLWNPPHRYKWPSSIIHIYSQCHYTVTFFFITNKTLGNPLSHQSETELQSKIQIKLSLSLSLSQPKKKKSKHCRNEKPRAVRTEQNNAVRKTNRKSQIPVSKNEKFYQLRRNEARNGSERSWGRKTVPFLGRTRAILEEIV